MRISELYAIDPKLALDHVLDKAERYAYHRSAHLWRSWMGTDGVRYGSFNAVNRKMLEGRQYIIELVDYTVGIHFTDELHDPKTYKKVPKV